MTLRLYNTLSRSLEPFEPLDPPRVRVYGCGPTVYDYPHIGNYRSFVVYDLLHRYLEWCGHDVRLVVNLTDVDDRTIAAAARGGVPLAEHTAPFARAYLADARTLGILPADAHPRATDYVERMVDFVAALVDKGLGYVTDDGSVYFSVRAFPAYGRLSGVDPAALRPGQRVASGRLRQGRRPRLRALEGGQARGPLGRRGVALALGGGPPGLAPGVFGDEHRRAGQDP